MLFKGTHFEHRESHHVPLRIDLFHHLIVGGFPEIAFLALEDDLQGIAVGVVPDLYVLALHRTVHRSSVAVPGRSSASISRAFGTSGSRSRRRLLTAAKTTTAM